MKYKIICKDGFFFILKKNLLFWKYQTETMFKFNKKAVKSGKTIKIIPKKYKELSFALQALKAIIKNDDSKVYYSVPLVEYL